MEGELVDMVAITSRKKVFGPEPETALVPVVPKTETKDRLWPRFLLPGRRGSKAPVFLGAKVPVFANNRD